MSVGATVTRVDRVLWRRTLDGVVVLPPWGDVIQLDRTGSLIWELVATPTTIESVVEATALACSVDIDDVMTGTHTVLVALRDAGVVRETLP